MEELYKLLQSLVPGAGVEPARDSVPRDFKTCELPHPLVITASKRYVSSPLDLSDYPSLRDNVN